MKFFLIFLKNILILSTILNTFIFAYTTTFEDKATFSDFKELNIEDLLNKDVSIATKTNIKVSEAPAIITVITAKEIENMGAKTLTDILDTVNGFETSTFRTGLQSVGIRGFKDVRANSKILLMFNGLPINTIMYGRSINSPLDVDSIEKIEIIRGPGSALYGRNAFQSVINVITKTGTQNKKVEASFETGSNGAKYSRVAYGISDGDNGLYFSANHNSTEKYNSKFFSNMDYDLEDWGIDDSSTGVTINGDYGDLKFSGFFYDRNLGTSIGPFITDSKVDQTKGAFSLDYKFDISNKVKLLTKIGYFSYEETQHLIVFEKGVFPPFPEGMATTPSYNEYSNYLESYVLYEISKTSNLIIGAQAVNYGVKNCQIKSNYDLSTGAPLTYYEYNEESGNYDLNYYGIDNQQVDPNGWITDNGHDYTNYSLFAQFTFTPFKDSALTLGGRYDKDSEFDSVFSPRCGLIWNLGNKTHLKILYSEAYRAPNTQEQYKTVGFAKGNPNIQPEYIKTFEIELGTRKFQKLNSSINLFYNYIEDLIFVRSNPVTGTNTYQNIGENKSYGFEINNKLILRKDFYLFFDYAYANSTDIFKYDEEGNLLPEINEENHKNISAHKINLGINYNFSNKYNINLIAKYRGDKDYFDPTNKDKVGSYILIDSNFRIFNIFKGFEFNISIKNLLNTEYYSQEIEDIGNAPFYPTSSHRNPQMPGRTFLFGINYNF